MYRSGLTTSAFPNFSIHPRTFWAYSSLLRQGHECSRLLSLILQLLGSQGECPFVEYLLLLQVTSSLAFKRFTIIQLITFIITLTVLMPSPLAPKTNANGILEHVVYLLLAIDDLFWCSSLHFWWESAGNDDSGFHHDDGTSTTIPRSIRFLQEPPTTACRF